MKEGERTSKVLVENARVLSLGGQTGSPSSAAGAGFGLEAMVPSASTITIEVRPQDALEIQTAKQMGQIGLILRSSTDTQGMDKTEINEGDVSGNKSRGPGRSSRGDCIRGYIKSGGQNLMLGCDGSISAVLNSDEP